MKNRKITISFDVYKCVQILAILYVVFLVVCVAFSFRGSLPDMFHRRNYNYWNRTEGFPNVRLIPFETIFGDLKELYRSSVRFGFFGRLLCYVPTGILIPVLLSPYRYHPLRAFSKTFFFSCILIVCIETIQYFSFFGVFNVDDIILGMIGTLFGYIIYLIGKRCVKRFFNVSDERSA